MAARRNAEAQEVAVAERAAEMCCAAAAAVAAAVARRAELAALRAREEAESGAEAEKRFRRCSWCMRTPGPAPVFQICPALTHSSCGRPEQTLLPCTLDSAGSCVRKR